MDWEKYREYFFDSSDMPYLWLITIVVMVIVGFVVVWRARGAKILKTTKKYLVSNGLFLLLYAITRMIFLFSNYYPETHPNTYESYQEFQILIRIAYIVGLAGLTNLTYGVESNFLNTKGKIALLPGITLIVAIFLPYDIFRITAYVVNSICVAIVLGLYIYVYAKGAGNIRKIALLNVLGLLAMFFATAFDSVTGKNLFTDAGARWVAYQLSPFLMLVGVMIMYKGWLAQQTEV